MKARIVLICAVALLLAACQPAQPQRWESYTIATASSPDELIVSVRSLMSAGWVPVGGVAATPSSAFTGQTEYAQALALPARTGGAR